MFDTTVSTEIVINAPPSTVRRGLLNFATWDHWNPMINQVVPPPGKTPENIVPGDKLGVNFIILGNSKGEVTIKSNNEEELTWLGVAGTEYIFGGRHFFQFHELTADGVTKTRFVHGEDFTGLLIPLYFAYVGREKSEETYMGLNRAFKEYVENL